MAVLSESAVYEAGIYQLETTDPVVGGASGTSNVQAKQLANRTAWLKSKIDAGGLAGDAATYTGNMDTLTTSGLFNVTIGSTNKPEANAGFTLVMAAGSSPRFIKQFWIGAATWFRSISSGTITTVGPWTKLQADLGLTGSVAVFAKNAAPTGWLKCNGAAVDRTLYAGLFSIIGTTYGVGDGASTFNVPDLRGEFIRGHDDGRSVDTGRVFGSAQADDVKAHRHQLATVNSGGGSSVGYGLGSPNTGSLTAAGIDNVQNFGGESRPRNIAMLYCIKY